MVAPLAIGFTLMMRVYAGGHLPGGHYNPAAIFWISAMGLSAWGNPRIYLVPTLVGGAVAAVVYRYVNQDR